MINKKLFLLAPLSPTLPILAASCCSIKKQNDENISAYAKVNNFADFKKVAETNALKGVYTTQTIEITEDIIVTKPTYVFNDLIILTKSNHSITRSPSFLGDMFVVGEDDLGNNPILTGQKAKLTFKTENDSTLTIDGNKDNIVNEQLIPGSAIYVTNHSDLNINNNIVIKNCRKDKNERILSTTLSSAKYAGGSAICNVFGTTNIYGGTITDCLTTGTSTGEDVKTAAYGGAIYSYSGLNMFGGLITNCSGSLGGGMFIYKTTVLERGEINSCSATKYGGAIYLADSQYAEIYLGTDAETSDKFILKNNSAAASGGAIFSKHQGCIVSLGHCLFEGNSAQNNGGAINSYGSVLLDNAEFISNKATGTNSKGGAIYHYLDNTELTPREIQINGCKFESNSAKNGGAIGFGSDKTDSGTIGYIENTIFKTNTATYDGGALYVAKKSTINVKSSTFDTNTATHNGGACYVTNSTLSLEKNKTKNTFSKNSAENGGAIAVHSGGLLNCNQSLFDQNKTSKKGGALYLYGGNANIESTQIGDVIISNNSATVGGGGIYIEATNDNTATLNISYITINNNTSSGNGGGIYAYTNALVNIQNLNLVSNQSGTSKNGGGMYISGSAVVTLDNVSAEKNTASSGGFVYITVTGTTLIIKKGSALNNEATAGDGKGSTLWCNTNKSIVKIKGTTGKQYFNFDGDISGASGFEVQDYEE